LGINAISLEAVKRETSQKLTGESKQGAMINVKDAAAKAVGYFKEIYGSQFENLLLEEVERDADYWYITLGYDLPSILPQYGGKAPRGFKVFKIDASTGEVLSMKIREVAAVE
jgi:hypothetical protein